MKSGIGGLQQKILGKYWSNITLTLNETNIKLYGHILFFKNSS